MKCEECQENQGVFLCNECDQVLCLSCDYVIHSGGNRNKHFKSLSCSECRSASTLNCTECCKTLCESCRSLHSTHSIIRLNLLNSVAVLWDVSRVRHKKSSVERGITELKLRYKELKCVKVYSDCWEDEDLDPYDPTRGLKSTEGIFIDLCLLMGSGISMVLIISDDHLELKRKLKLFKGINSKITISNTLFPPASPPEHEPDFENAIKEEMENGKIIFTKTETLERLVSCLNCSLEQAENKLRQLVNTQVLIEKKFLIHQTEIFLYSLSMKNKLREAVKYAIKALKYDELIPNKKNIIIKLQKVFNIETTKRDLAKILNKLVTRKRSASCLKDAETYIKSRKLFYKFGDLYRPIDHARPFTASKSILALYDYFLSFCQSYFEVHYKKSIILGRFGLILLVKHLGPSLLKNLTTGKILFLITKAISDGHFIYYRSSLIWSKHLSALPLAHLKLAEIKSAILALLSTLPSLKISKLGTYLRNYYNIKLNPLEFGFSDLRQLLSTMTELNITGPNIDLKLPVEKLAKTLQLIISSNPQGVSLSSLSSQLASSIQVNWKDYQVSDISSFIQKHLSQTIETQKTPLSFRCKIPEQADRKVLNPSQKILFDMSSNSRILKLRSFSVMN